MFSNSHLLRKSAGLVGLPNVGKSTLFNALTRSQKALAANFPFTTIKPNHGRCEVYDARMHTIAAFANSERIVPATVKLVDIAGLITGASKGEGLGNAFLADISPMSVVLHCVRCTEWDGCASDGISAPDPLTSIQIVDNELVIKDYESVEKRLGKGGKKKKQAAAQQPPARKGDFNEAEFTASVLEWLESGKAARDLPSIQPLSEDDNSNRSADQRRIAQAMIDKRRACINEMQLLSAKPTIYVLNVNEQEMRSGNQFSKLVQDKFGADRCVTLCSLIEEQCAQMETRQEQLELLEAYDVTAPAADELLQKTYQLLGLQQFFTVGPIQTKSWSIRTGDSCRRASGEIHGDFEKHFSSARVLPWDQFIQHSNLKAAEAKLQRVGENYIMKDGDVMVVEHDAKR